jgi:hypothetical protein
VLSQDAAARKFATGDHDKAEIASPGGKVRGTSLFKSPPDFLTAVEVGPKDIVYRERQLNLKIENEDH